MFGTQLLFEAIEDFPMAVSMQLETVGTGIIAPSSDMIQDGRVLIVQGPFGSICVHSGSPTF